MSWPCRRLRQYRDETSPSLTGGLLIVLGARNRRLGGGRRADPIARLRVVRGNQRHGRARHTKLERNRNGYPVRDELLKPPDPRCSLATRSAATLEDSPCGSWRRDGCFRYSARRYGIAADLRVRKTYRAAGEKSAGDDCGRDARCVPLDGLTQYTTSIVPTLRAARRLRVRFIKWNTSHL